MDTMKPRFPATLSPRHWLYADLRSISECPAHQPKPKESVPPQRLAHRPIDRRNRPKAIGTSPKEELLLPGIDVLLDDDAHSQSGGAEHFPSANEVLTDPL